MIDEKGRCCGRKPIPYKRTGHLFCPRCDRAYGIESKTQINNWAWRYDLAGRFVATYPDHDYAKERGDETRKTS